jgi:uncharacterized protein
MTSMRIWQSSVTRRYVQKAADVVAGLRMTHEETEGYRFMIDLDRLDAYLSSDMSPEQTLLLSDLNGFLHGIACSPIAVVSSEWMPAALGVSSDSVPEWVLEDIGSMYMSILEGLSIGTPEIEPVFWQDEDGRVIAMDWCEGFMEAVKLRPDAWDAFAATAEGAKLMTPILIHMVDESGKSAFGLAPEALDAALPQAAEAIPMVVPAIFRLQAADRQAAQ